ncbi:MAG: hypothetical protein B6U94_00660 [Thermofilum sp. ex4484_79]|nr:MAG: hypothetical protein B6U94_00660 [Thermofilum sp. ex4484_79]
MGLAVNYSEITNVFIREVESNKLLNLDVDFYEKARRYINRLEGRKDKEFSEYEAKVLRLTLEKLFLIRIRKALDHIWRYGEKPNVQVPIEEAEVIDAIYKIVEHFRTIIPSGKETLFPTSEKGTHERAGVDLRSVLVFFIKPYAKISIGEGEILGPFVKGDLALVPYHIAKDLEGKGIVEILG